MSNEIATYSMIKSKTTFGSDGTECPTKTVIKAISSYIIINNESSYGANECVKIDDIDAIRYIFKYYNHIGDTKWNVGAAGNQLFVTVESRRSDNSTNVPFSFKQLPSWLSRSSIRLKDDDNTKYYMILTASANTSTSARSGTVIIEQNESGLTLEYEVEQAGDSISTYGDWTVSVSANPTTISSDGGTSTITASAKRTIYWESGDVTEETGNPTLSTNLGSLSSTASPSTLTLGENTSTSSRTATITASYSGKSATCTVTQAAGESPDVWDYVFSVNPYQVSVGSGGGSGTVTITSYETLNGSWYRDVSYSIDSSTLPSWATYDGGGSFTISANTSSSSRSAQVYFVQDESGKRDYAELTQTGYTPPADNYVFTWEDGSTSDTSASFPWDFSANGTAANIPVISTKNGSSQSWSVSSKPSWITTSTTSSKVTISASDNSGSARSGEVVLTQSGSGKTLTVNVSQGAKPAENVYVFTITPNTYDASYSNASFIPRTVSTKNGSKIGYSLTSGDTDWVVVSTTGKITVEIMKNTTSSSRSTTLVFTQNESGKTQSIEITQSGQPAEYKFGFGSDLYSTDSVTCGYQGGEFRNFYQVVSTKNGSNQSYYVSQRPIWINGYSSGKVSIQENTSTASRNGDVILTQDESGKTITLKVTQRGKPEEYLSIFNSDISTTAEYAVVNFKSSQPWTCGLTDYDADNPVIVGNTTGDASDTAQVAITYWKEYRRPRRVNYNIRQTAGQKLTASGSITFN